MNPLRYLTLSVIAAGLLPAAGAHAQYYDYGATRQSAPLYPYAVQNSYDVAPNTYGIERPVAAHAHPYAGRRASHVASEPKAPALDRSHKKADRALIEQLRRRASVKRTVVNAKRIVHDAPAAIADSKTRAGRDDNKKRVIRADAEITILGPDRMSIRLFRKGQGPGASARVE